MRSSDAHGRDEDDCFSALLGADKDALEEEVRRRYASVLCVVVVGSISPSQCACVA